MELTDPPALRCIDVSGRAPAVLREQSAPLTGAGGRGFRGRVRLRIAAICAALAFAGCAAAAQGAGRCAPHDDMVSVLADRYGEARVNVGIVGDAQGDILAIMETFQNPGTGTWTILLTTPDGEACLLSSGGMFRAVDLPPKGDPA